MGRLGVVILAPILCEYFVLFFFFGLTKSKKDIKICFSCSFVLKSYICYFHVICSLNIFFYFKIWKLYNADIFFFFKWKKLKVGYWIKFRFILSINCSFITQFCVFGIWTHISVHESINHWIKYFTCQLFIYWLKFFTREKVTSATIVEFFKIYVIIINQKNIK